MLPKILKPKHKFDLIRLGGDNDGGYLVEKKSVLSSSSLISCGLGYNWTFEKNYYDLVRKPIYCYDHTVNYNLIKKKCALAFGSYLFRSFKPKYYKQKKFFKNMYRDIFLFRDYKNFFKKNILHIEKKIGSPEGIMLHEIITKSKDYTPHFIKIDIENYEYNILDELIKYQDFFSGIVIEFHNINQNLVRIEKFVGNLKLTLVHIHAQNSAGTTNNTPNQIELTFSKQPKIIGEINKLPHPLDQSADPQFSDIEINFND